jgi:hypothetical protein
MSHVSNSIGSSQPSRQISGTKPPDPVTVTVTGHFAGYCITPQRASAQRFLAHFCPTIGIANGGEPPFEPPQ